MVWVRFSTKYLISPIITMYWSENISDTEAIWGPFRLIIIKSLGIGVEAAMFVMTRSYVCKMRS